MQKFYNALSDALSIARNLWLVLLLNTLITLAFLATSQGPDVLLSLIEDLSYFHPSGHYAFYTGPFIFLMASLLYWAMSAELAARWAIYLSDNSGRSLSPERIEARKRAQRRTVRVLLWFPVVLMALAFGRAISREAVTLNGPQKIAVVVVYLGLAVIAFIIYLLYAYKKGVKWYCYPPFSWFCPSRVERSWSGKLFGIYNDLRIDLSGPLPPGTTGEGYLPAGIRLPNGLRLPPLQRTPWLAASQPGNPSPFQLLPGYPITEKGGNQVWMYRAPRLFYRQLLHQLHFFAALGAVLIGLGALLSVNAFFVVGTAALLCFACGAWAVVVVYIRYLDKMKTRWRYPVPVRLLLLAFFLFSTWKNNDHPVRLAGAPLPPAAAAARLALDSQSYRDWLSAVAADSIAYRIQGTDSTQTDTLPIVFVTAEGGALRTGAFTALTLAHLLENYPQLLHNIYGYSTVSGGTVGANFFNAVTQHAAMTGGGPDSCRRPLKQLFGKDYLSAIMARLLTGEIINYFWPFSIGRFDRMAALEKGWEKAWTEVFPQEADSLNLLRAPFITQAGKGRPALFINTTEVETGLQCLWTNRNISGPPQRMPAAFARDVAARSGAHLHYSTAIGLSARFPLISPAAAFQWTTKNAEGKNVSILRHYVDGGYYENKGVETMLQVLEAVKANSVLKMPDGKYLWVRPYVFQFNFGDPDDPNDSADIRNIPPVRAFNELSEVLVGIYNTRNGRGRVQQLHLNSYLKRTGAVPVSFYLPLSERRVPMSWILSNAALDTLDGLAGQLARQQGEAFLKRWK